MRPYTLIIDAGQEEVINLKGNYLRLYKCAGIVTVKSPLNHEEWSGEQGDDVVLSEFKELRFSHDSAAQQTIIVMVGRNTRAGSSKVSGDMVIKAGATVVTGTDAAIAAGVSAEVAAANADRHELHVFVDPTNAATAPRWGGPDVAAGKGIPIPVGAPFVITTKAAVHIHNPAGNPGAITVSTNEVRK